MSTDGELPTPTHHEGTNYASSIEMINEMHFMRQSLEGVMRRSLKGVMRQIQGLLEMLSN